jgi:hypothetical protein
MRQPLALAVAPALAGALSACGPVPEDTVVHARLASPDGQLEAVYLDDTGVGPVIGATRDVYVVTAGGIPHYGEQVFSRACANNLALAWNGPRALTISYDVAPSARDDAPHSAPWPFSLFPSADSAAHPPYGVTVRMVRRVTPAGSC